MSIDRIIRFFTEEIWQIPLHTLSRQKSFFLRQLRIVILAIRGFYEDKCHLRASALTFYFILSVVPLMAFLFGIAKGFALEKFLEKELLERLQGQEEVATRLIGFGHSYLESTKGGWIAGIGVIVLFFLVFKLLVNIEASFNDIWGVKHSRTLGRKLSDYFAIMLVCPVLLVASSSATVFVKTQVMAIAKGTALLEGISPLILFSLQTLPFLVSWLLLTFIFIFMPNTKVRFWSGLLGGIVAGTIFEGIKWLYITSQIFFTEYGAIYGSFAALPLFLIWVQASWFVVLLGAEISFASQNVDTYEFEPDYLRVTPAFKKLLALRITHLCTVNFRNGEASWTAEQISRAIEAPIRLVKLILYELVQCRVLNECKQADGGEGHYQPARDLESLSISYVIHALDSLGSGTIPIAQSKELERISACLREFKSAIEQSEANVLLKDI